ncbi:hypothetical protein K439DRAFT_1663733 [Ramaria rubella]|nr:hypothetical protein K439DRAFT_1663733 [Ramaria rubella]
MSRSSKGGGTRATSPNTQGNRTSRTKQKDGQEDDRTDDVFIGPQSGPRTRTTPTPPNAWFDRTQKFVRSPPGNAPANQKRKIAIVNDRHRSDTIYLPKSSPEAIRAGMEVEPAAGDRAANPNGDLEDGMSIESEDCVPPIEADLIASLKKCIDLSDYISYGHADFEHKDHIVSLYRTLGRSLELERIPNTEGHEYEYEGINESMHAPKNNPTETITDDQFDTLTQVILQNRTTASHLAASQPRQNTVLNPMPQETPTGGPRASFASGPVFKPIAKPKLIWNFAARHHDSRLIVKINPVPSRELQAANSGLRIRDAINEKLHTNHDTKHMFIGLVSWSNTGSTIINTADGLTAAELEPHAHLFQNLLPHVAGATFTTQMDSPWHKVTVNGVPTRGGGYSDGMDTDHFIAPTSQQLLDELLQYNGWLKSCKRVGEPRWISPPATLGSKDKSSFVIAFATKEDADELVKRRGVFMFGH